MRVALVQGLDVLRVPVDDHAADPAQLPLAADAVRCSAGCFVRFDFNEKGGLGTYVDLRSPYRRCLVPG